MKDVVVEGNVLYTWGRAPLQKYGALRGFR